MLGWKNGKWDENAKAPTENWDEESLDAPDQDKFLSTQGYSKTQLFGNPDGYGYELWEHFEGNRWIVILNTGSVWYEVFVEGVHNLVDLMTHLAPGATAAVLDGNELSHIWTASARQREFQADAARQLEGLAKEIQRAVTEPCQCEACKAQRLEQQSGMN